MHIVYVTGAFANGNNDVLGGMPIYIYKIAKYMQEKGHKVKILTVGKEKKTWEYKGVPVYSVCLPGMYGNSCIFVRYILLPIIREAMFNKSLYNINKEDKISIVQYAGWYGVGMMYNRKIPSVLRISTYIKAQLPLSHTPLELFIVTIQEKMAARNFYSIIAPSKALGEIYGIETKRKVNIIETPYYSANNIEEDYTIYNKNLKGEKYFLFFGRISMDKGIYTIARVLQKILDKYPKHYFCFAGDIYKFDNKNIMKSIQKKAGIYFNRVKYLGHLSHEKLYPCIKNAECIIMPSLMDNLPNACLEAMDLNGIVIGTRGASFDEIFEDGISGLLIDIDDSHALAEKIDVVMQMTESEKEQMRLNAKKCLKKYNPEIAGDKLERYYKKIISLWLWNKSRKQCETFRSK